MCQSQVSFSSLSILSFILINAFLLASAQDKSPNDTSVAEAPASFSLKRSKSSQYTPCLLSSNGEYELALLVNKDNAVSWVIFRVKDNEPLIYSISENNNTASASSFISLNFTSEGNLEMYIDNTQIWGTNVTGKGGDTLELLDGPELIIFNSKRNTVIWNATAEIEDSSSPPEVLTPTGTPPPSPSTQPPKPAPRSGKTAPAPSVAPQKKTNASSGKIGGTKLSTVGLSAGVACLLMTLF